MKEWLFTILVLALVVGCATFLVFLGIRAAARKQVGLHISDYNIVELTWDGCQYLRFGGTERILIHKANCTNAAHWKELERR